MECSETEINGFFNIHKLGEKFEQKVKEKEYDKFDGILPEQLNSKIILAINYAYDDDYNVFLTSFKNKYFKNFEGIIHKEIDGLLLYHHDIAKGGSLTISSLIMKKSQ